MATALIVSSDSRLRRLLAETIENRVKDVQVHQSSVIKDAVDKVHFNEYDLIILDKGLSLAALSIRIYDDITPIYVLTSSGSKISKITGIIDSDKDENTILKELRRVSILHLNKRYKPPIRGAYF